MNASAHAWRPTPTALSEFRSPGLVIAGEGSTNGLARVVTEEFGLGVGRILLAVDDAVVAAGLIDPIETELSAQGFSVLVRGGFGAEPTEDVVDQVVEEARSFAADVVIGVGGGSVLDSSKLIALMLKNPGTCSNWVGAVSPANGVAPLILIPTTCGTGAEATRIAMVTVSGNKRASSCAGYIPPVAVLDSQLLGSLPKKVVAATAMDALAHATESLMSSSASMLSAHHALRAIEILRENLEAAADGDKDALAMTLWGSHLAGQALNAGVVLGHSMAYCLAHTRPMPHGVSCALALPYCIAYNQNLDGPLARALASTLTQGRSEELRDAAEEILHLSARLGLPTTLGEAGIGVEEASPMARLCVTDYPRPSNPETFDETGITELFRAMGSGDLDAAFAITAR